MFNNKKAEFLIAALLILSSVSCAEDVLLPGEERGVWMLVPPLRETIGSDIRATAEGPDGELYVATRRAVSGDGTGLVLLTDDAGLTWDIGGKGMNPDRRIFEFEILEDGTAFAGMERGGVFRSCDRGMTWKQVNNHLPDLELRSIVTIPDGRLLVSTYFNGLFLSSDRGDRWDRCLSD
ncbi:MAG: glycoside hydrolase, partial [Bacteroidales bacterium]|nr:glycoside hydrolase [Candidatus Latescibacterota bacterium]